MTHRRLIQIVAVAIGFLVVSILTRGGADGSGIGDTSVVPTGLLVGMVDYWKANESGGDLLGAYAGKTFTQAGSVGANTGRVYATAREYHGPGTADQHDRNNDDVRFGNVDFTVGVWWYQYTTPSGAYPRLYHYLVQQDGWDGGYTLALDGGSQLLFMSAEGNGVTDIFHSSVLPVPNNVWHFALCWYTAADHMLHMVIDNGPELTRNTGARAIGTNTVRIGGDSSTGNTMDGRIGPLMMWRRVLTPAERASLWNNGTGLTYEAMLGGPTATSTKTALPPTTTNTATATALPPTSTPTNTPLPPTATSTPTRTSLPPTSTSTPTSTSLLPTPSKTPTPVTPVATSVAANWFKVGTGYSDVITRQLVRTASDKVYLFSLYSTTSRTILAYWTDQPGVPTSATSFTGHTQFDVPGQPISVDAVYDGQSIVHVLINVVSADLSHGTLTDYPFDVTTNAFKPAFTIDGNVPFRTNLPIGTAGVSGMVGRDGTLHVAYWSNLPSTNHITYKAYAYSPGTNGFVLKEGPTQIDTNRTDGMANHPALVVSPRTGDVTIAWIWQSLPFPPSQAAVYARTRTASGWGSINQVNNSAYKPWVDPSPSLGLNVDQGPSMVITSDGTIHLSYNEDAYTSGGTTYDYGRVHYVTATSGSSWVDTLLIDGLGHYYYTHDPSLTTDSSDRIYLFGHTDWRNSAPCTASYPAAIICYMKMNPNGTWTAPQQVKDKNGNAMPPSNPQETFDDSVSMKWGVVGWNRPELVEFAFFSGKAQNYWDMALYYGTLGN